MPGASGSFTSMPCRLYVLPLCCVGVVVIFSIPVEIIPFSIIDNAAWSVPLHLNDIEPVAGWARSIEYVSNVGLPLPEKLGKGYLSEGNVRPFNSSR